MSHKEVCDITKLMLGCRSSFVFLFFFYPPVVLLDGVLFTGSFVCYVIIASKE